MTQERRKMIQLGLLAPFAVKAVFAQADIKVDLESITQRLNVLARSMVADGVTAGISIGFIHNQSKSPVIANAGFANLETKSLVKNETVFRVASITKQFTAAAILLLSEQGKLKVADKLEKFIPTFPNASSITLDHLLTHTSGLHDYTWGELPANHSHNFAMEAKPNQILAKMNPLWDFDIGTQYNYSNSGYLLLGEVIEIVSGMSYALFLEKNFFTPLSMLRTKVDENSEVVLNRSTGYDSIDGKRGQFSNAEFSTLPFSAGAIRSNTADLLTWSAALHTGRIISSVSLERMRRIAKVVSGKPIGEARYFPPNSSRGTPPAFVKQSDYGYGLEISQMFDRRVAWHSGGINGFNSLLFHGIDFGAHVAVLANTRNGAVSQFETFAKLAALGVL